MAVRLLEGLVKEAVLLENPRSLSSNMRGCWEGADVMVRGGGGGEGEESTMVTGLQSTDTGAGDSEDWFLEKATGETLRAIFFCGELGNFLRT